MYHPYDGPDQPCSIEDAVREYTWNVGADNPDRAWILSNYDSWHPNPFYHGPPVPHPEDDIEQEIAHENEQEVSTTDDQRKRTFHVFD